MNQLGQGLDLAQPPGGYGPPPGGGPPGGWGPPPGGAPPGGWGPPGGGPPGGGPPGGGAPPGGWGPPGGGPPGGPPGGAPPGGWGPPGGAPPGGGWGPPGGPPPGAPPGGYGAPPGGYGPPPGAPGYPPGPPGYPPGGGGYPGAPPPGFPGPGGAKATFSPGDAITFAWERIKADPGTILATIIVGLIIVFIVSFTINFVAQLIVGLAGVATSVATGAASRRHAAPALDLMAAPLAVALMGVGQLVSLVVSTFFTAGIMNFSLKVARGAPYAFGDIFSGAPFFLSLLAANLIMGLGILVGSICLIVPGVILALGLSMSMPLIVDWGLGPIDALKASWQLTDGNKGTIFIFWLIAFGLSIAGMCACGVGILLVIPLLYIALMYAYLKLSGQPVAQVARAA